MLALPYWERKSNYRCRTPGMLDSCEESLTERTH